MALPFLFTAFLFGGSVYYQHRQAKKAQAKARQAEAQAQVEAQAAFHRSMQVQVQDYPRVMVFGYENKIGGNLIWMHRAENTNYQMVIALCVNRLWSVKLVYIDDEIICSDTEIVGDYRFPPKHAGERYGNQFGIYIVNSTPNTKPDYATAIWPTNLGRYPDPSVWTIDHWRARGFAFACVAISANPDLFSGPPNLSFVVTPTPQYTSDWHTNNYRRVDSLANPVYALKEYLCSEYGLNQPLRVDTASFTAAANAWMVPPPLSATPILKSETTYIADLTKDHRDHIDALLDCCNGRLIISGGKFKVQVGIRSTFVMNLTPDGFVGRFNVRPTIPGRDRFNAVNVRYTNRDKLWAQDNYLHTLDGVEPADRIVKDIDLAVSTADGCAQVAAQLVREQLNQITIECDYDIRAMQLEAGDIVRVTNPKYGFDDKEFEVEQMRFESEQGEIKFRLNLQEYDPDIYNMAEAPDAWADGPETNLPNKNFVPTPTELAVSEELYRIGDVITNRVNISYLAELYFTAEFEIQYRRFGDSDWKNGAITSQLNASFDLDVTEADDYEFRVSAVNSFNFRSPWVQVTKEILGKTAPPADITGLQIDFVGAMLEATWDKNTDMDLSHYRVDLQTHYRPEPSIEFMPLSIEAKSNEVSVKIPNSAFYHPPDFWIEASVVAVDTTGNESEVPATAKIGHKKPHIPLNLRVQKIKSKIMLNWDEVLKFDSELIVDTAIQYRFLELDRFNVYRSKEGTGITAQHGQVKGSFFTYDESEPGTYYFSVTWTDVLNRESDVATIGPITISGEEEYDLVDAFVVTPKTLSENSIFGNSTSSPFYFPSAGYLNADETMLFIGVAGFYNPVSGPLQMHDLASNSNVGQWSTELENMELYRSEELATWDDEIQAGFEYWAQPSVLREGFPHPSPDAKQNYLSTGSLPTQFFPGNHRKHAALMCSPVYDLGQIFPFLAIKLNMDLSFYGDPFDLIVEVVSCDQAFTPAQPAPGTFPAHLNAKTNRGTFVTITDVRYFYVRLIAFNKTGREMVGLSAINISLNLESKKSQGKANVLATDYPSGTEVTMDKSFYDIRGFSATVKGYSWSVVPNWDETTHPNKIWLFVVDENGDPQNAEVLWEVRGV